MSMKEEECWIRKKCAGSMATIKAGRLQLSNEGTQANDGERYFSSNAHRNTIKT